MAAAFPHSMVDYSSSFWCVGVYFHLYHDA